MAQRCRPYLHLIDQLESDMLNLSQFPAGFKNLKQDLKKVEDLSGKAADFKLRLDELVNTKDVLGLLHAEPMLFELAEILE